MTLYQTLLLLSAIFPLLIYTDYREKRKADSDQDSEFDLNSRNSGFVLSFAPFLALFYTEHFWITLLYLIPLYLYFGLLMYIANKKQWCPFFVTDIAIYGSSGLMVTIIGYFIWFHEGVLSPSETTVVSVANEKAVIVVWPFYVMAGLFIAGFIVNKLASKKNRSEANAAFKILALQAIGYPVLPLFTDYYWWTMLAGLVAYVIALPIILRVLTDSSRGGIGFVLGYIYMMAATGSILLYAFLF